jgi:hypothetical protein
MLCCMIRSEYYRGVSKSVFLNQAGEKKWRTTLIHAEAVFLNLAQGLKFLFSFLYEPVFCHSLTLLWERVYVGYLYFVSTVPNDMNLLRIM